MSIKKISAISQRARNIDKEKRGNLLKSIAETEMHRHLKELFKAMQPDYVVEITHGPTELGKDLVIVKKDHFGYDVIAVIVKCGDIKAETLGGVDEIKGKIRKTLSSGDRKVQEMAVQIEEAIVHPAELKRIFERLQIGKIFCVVVGECSKQARDRLEKEALQNNAVAEVFDLNWLVDRFTDFYPQIFFEGRVMDFIQQKIETLEAKHCLSKKGINLSEYYVEPLVSRIGAPVKLASGHLNIADDNKQMPFSQLKQIVGGNKKILLIGDPGSGKSGALAKFAIDMFKQADVMVYRRETKKKISVPVLICANDILKISGVEDLVKGYFQPVEIKGRFHVSALMLDGLDEAPSDKRSEILGKAQEYAEALSCSLIVTSRRIDIVEMPPEGFQKYELLHFQFGQAIKFFEKVVLSKGALSSLRSGLEKIKSQIPMIPLSLMFLVELAEENKEIPASVTELYDRYYDIALGRWDKDKGITVLFDYLVKKNFFAALAYDEFLKKDRLEIPRKDFENYFQSYTVKYSGTPNDAELFMREIERVGVLDIREEVMFRHRSILDYFAAYHIFDKRAEIENLSQKVRDLYFNDLWSEVAFFYVGLRREINEEILGMIFAYEAGNPSSLFGKVMAGRLLQAGWHSPSKLRLSGLKKSIGYAPSARDAFLHSAEEDKADIPAIFADIVLMGLSEVSYGSLFLFKDLQIVLKEIGAEITAENVYKSLLLLVASRRFWPADKLRAEVNGLLEASAQLPAEDRARTLIMAMVAEHDDKPCKNAIKNKLQRLVKKNPSMFKKLFPDKRKRLA